MGDQPPQDIEQHTDQMVSRRIRVDHWQCMSPAQRDEFAAHVLTGWPAGRTRRYRVTPKVDAQMAFPPERNP